MAQEKKTTLEPPDDKRDGEDASELDPCQRARVEAEVADHKPAASGLTLRSTSSKC